ncbi:hypothetical protein ACFFON_02470 [Arthrobacter citreus]|uniref:hypothetical protein n=1 Tax=Arthrobacter TaxID=1663 RepID=UPI001264B03C|nr:hypothetical protein [Arthrobacter gandavensis]
MSTIAPPPARLRPSTLFQGLAAALSIPLALVVPLWITAGRTLFGVEGPMVVIFTATVGPLLAILLLVSAVRITVSATRRPTFGAPLRTSFLLLAVWVAGGALGFLVPDVGGPPDSQGSVMSVLLGDELVGISAALANPMGILTLGLSISLIVVSRRQE